MCQWDKTLTLKFRKAKALYTKLELFKLVETMEAEKSFVKLFRTAEHNFYSNDVNSLG